MTMQEIRFNKLYEEMNKKGLDAVYVSSPENHLYFSHFDNHDGYLVLTKKNSYVFADFRYTEAAREAAFPGMKVCNFGEPSFEDIVQTERCLRVGYEDQFVSCAALAGLKKRMPQVEWVPLGDTFTHIRAIKTREEVDTIIKAQRIAEGAFHHILSIIHYDMTEIEVAAELEYYMKKNGSEKPSFDTIAVSGTVSSRPHGVPRPVKLEKGFLTMDYGAVVEGYHSDMTRTICIGKADEEQKKLYNTVLQAQLAALDKAALGVRNKDVDTVAREIIDNAGYKGCFGHGLGHGVGLLIHEMPKVHQGTGDTVLQVGEIITIEPGIYIEGKYGCRIEDMLYIKEDGKENLTNCPKELIEV